MQTLRTELLGILVGLSAWCLLMPSNGWLRLIGHVGMAATIWWILVGWWLPLITASKEGTTGSRTAFVALGWIVRIGGFLWAWLVVHLVFNNVAGTQGAAVSLLIPGSWLLTACMAVLLWLHSLQARC